VDRFHDFHCTDDYLKNCNDIFFMVQFHEFHPFFRQSMATFSSHHVRFQPFHDIRQLEIFFIYFFTAIYVLLVNKICYLEVYLLSVRFRRRRFVAESRSSTPVSAREDFPEFMFK